MQLINSENHFVLTWSENCFTGVGTVANKVPTFPITDTKLYVPDATLSTQVNAKLLCKLK